MDKTQQDEWLARISKDFVAYARKELNWDAEQFIEMILVSEYTSEDDAAELHDIMQSAMRFVLRCLTNPGCEGSDEVLQQIEEIRRGG